MSPPPLHPALPLALRLQREEFFIKWHKYRMSASTWEPREIVLGEELWADWNARVVPGRVFEASGESVGTNIVQACHAGRRAGQAGHVLPSKQRPLGSETRLPGPRDAGAWASSKAQAGQCRSEARCEPPQLVCPLRCRSFCRLACLLAPDEDPISSHPPLIPLQGEDHLAP